ncbi:hypothetical protein [Paraoerskovia sediminicola]|nr:hypothetical protein [Paraoerskovia sediminicola]
MFARITTKQSAAGVDYAADDALNLVASSAYRDAFPTRPGSGRGDAPHVDRRQGAPGTGRGGRER